MDAFEKAEKELDGTLPGTERRGNIKRTAVDGDDGRIPKKASTDLFRDSFKGVQPPRTSSIGAETLGLLAPGSDTLRSKAPGGNVPGSDDSTLPVGGDNNLPPGPTPGAEDTAMMDATLMSPPPRPRTQQSAVGDGMQPSTQSQQTPRTSILSTQLSP
jgi:hypothetical protein